MCRMVYGWTGQKVERVFERTIGPWARLARDFGSWRGVGYNGVG